MRRAPIDVRVFCTASGGAVRVRLRIPGLGLVARGICPDCGEDLVFTRGDGWHLSPGQLGRHLEAPPEIRTGALT